MVDKLIGAACTLSGDYITLKHTIYMYAVHVALAS